MESGDIILDDVEDDRKESLKLLPFKNIDPLGFFRSLAILLLYRSKSIISKVRGKFVKKKITKDFPSSFNIFVKSQYLKMYKSEKRNVLLDVFNILTMANSHEASNIRLCARNLDTEIQKANKILAQEGKSDIFFVYYIPFFRNRLSHSNI